MHKFKYIMVYRVYMSGSSHAGVVAVEFELSDPEYPFVGVSAAENCRVLLETMLPRGSGEFAEFFNIVGADPDRVLDQCEDSRIVRANLLSSYDDGGLFEFVVAGGCPAKALAERGAIPVEVEGASGDGRIVAEIPKDADPSTIVADFKSEFEGAELASKWEQDRLTPLITRSELQKALDERLTDRQHDVLETAYEAGYYEPDGDCTVAALGDRLDISPSTVSQHLAAAERELVSLVFEERVVE
jgi:DNA-binding CsgD family transcriptional regulator